MDAPAKSSSTRAAPASTSMRVVVAAVRLVWVAIAVVGGQALGEALAGHSRPVEVVGTVGAWIAWAVVALALAVPSTVGLTTVRMMVPGVVVAIVTAALAADSTVVAAVSVALAVVMGALSASGELGQAFVQGSAYGDERRFVLRPPAALLLPAVVTWCVWAACVLVGPLALAARGWAIGVPLTAAAVALTWFLAPRFHRLSRRWLVLVPAGVVIHDQVVLAETVMLTGPSVAGMSLALADTEAADLTGPAAGHAVEIGLREMTTVVLAPTRAKPAGTALHVRAVLVAPTRPGLALRSAAAAQHR